MDLGQCAAKLKKTRDGVPLRNRIDFSLTPDALFLDPVDDEGLRFLVAPEFIWRERDAARIEGFSISAYPVIRRKTEQFLRFTRSHKTFRRVIEFNTLPVLLEEASFRKSFAIAKGKCVLSGASGFRLMNRYCWENEGAADDPESRLVAYFHERQTRDGRFSFPVEQGPLSSATIFALQCRNTFNYFHFVTETLPHLCLLDDLSFRGQIHINHPNAPEKTRSFAMDLIRALFPEIAEQVRFQQAPQDYDRVLSSFNLINSYYHLPSDIVGSVDGLAPSDAMWKGTVATRSSQAVLSMNSVDTCLFRLRDRALRAVASRDVSHLPRRFYVARRPDQSRRRPLKGEEALMDLLKAFGFQKIHFEDYTPLDQIALMAGAEVMVSVHGAGFANMLFANTQALIIEIGSLQTAVHRWGDFWPIAHVAGCRYLSFFADHDMPDPLQDPDFATDGIVPVALSDFGIGRLAAFLAASLGHAPRLDRPDAVAELMRQLIRSEQTLAAEKLVHVHQDVMQEDAAFLSAKAELHRARGESHAELLALLSAWEANRSQWQTLTQILWCARKVERHDILRWAANTLAESFPDQCLSLVKTRPWLRDFL